MLLELRRKKISIQRKYFRLIQNRIKRLRKKELKNKEKREKD